jgi:hypothetical protein
MPVLHGTLDFMKNIQNPEVSLHIDIYNKFKNGIKYIITISNNK